MSAGFDDPTLIDITFDISDEDLSLAPFEGICQWGHVHNKHLKTCPLCLEGWETTICTFGDIK